MWKARDAAEAVTVLFVMQTDTFKSGQHGLYWSRRLLECLQEMAAQQTNAVLLALGDTGDVEIGRRYPDGGLTFANNRWRAFYHCHDAAAQLTNEHGHFHIFTDVGKQKWAHVAGLSIDTSGQPLHWFAVNRWVTEGPWLDHMKLLSQLHGAVDHDQDSLAGRWLFALLQLQQTELVSLFHSRNRQIDSHARGLEPAAVFENRDIYTLATKPIELQAVLEKHLLYEA